MPGTAAMLGTLPGVSTWAGDAGRERTSAIAASPQRCSWMLMGLLFFGHEESKTSYVSDPLPIRNPFVLDIA